jgi:uncharacterized protein YaaN involved in tellurite resistance
MTAAESAVAGDSNAVTQVPQQAPKSALSSLDAADTAKAQQLAGGLDTAQEGSISVYGQDAQKDITAFSSQVLSKVQSKDLGEVGSTLTDLMFNLKNSDPSELTAEQGFFEKMFKRAKKSIFDITAKYQKIDASVDKISARLDGQSQQLGADNDMLDELYTHNFEFFKQLNVYIAGAEIKLAALDSTDIPAAREAVAAGTDLMAAQKLSDLTAFQNRLEKRKYDLELTRELTIQQAPQIRLIQNTNRELSDKIASSINTAIPLWKNQLTVALTLLNQRQALASQRMVSDTTNALLEKNAEMLKTSAVGAAQENERGVVDLETLKKTQADLIDTIQQTMQIQAAGTAKRKASEVELAQLEADFKAKMAEISGGAGVGAGGAGGAAGATGAGAATEE